MKRLLAISVLVFMLCGCGKKADNLDRAMEFRQRLLSGDGCSFTVSITADYAETYYQFAMDCVADREGNLTFSVIEPGSISGITGKLESSGGKLTFDDQVLAFPTLAEGRLSPVSGPYVFLKALRGGYLNACGEDGEYLRVSVEDSYAEDALHLDIWLDGDSIPVRADICWQERRALSLTVSDFKIL